MKLHAIRLLVLTSIGSLAAGCLQFGSPTKGGRPVREVYEEGRSDDLVIRADGAPGGGPRTRPVIYPPKVFAVYVQEHLDERRDIKIGAHWVYFKLRDSSWVEQDIDREPFTEAEAADADLAPLRAALDSFPKMVIPYRAAPSKPESNELQND